MGQSNSKLSAEQKDELKVFKEENNGRFEFIQNPAFGYTLLLVPTNWGYRVSASYQSLEEKKFKNKVGQYWAMYRYKTGSFCYIVKNDFEEWYLNNPQALATLAHRIVFKR